MKYNKIAQILDEAAMNAQAIPQISINQPINLEQAYAIQGLSIARRYKRLEQFAGIKLGFTSRAKMEQMGVNDLIWGRLTDRMQYQDGEELFIEEFIHPRAEPEVAFRVKRTIDTIINEDNLDQYIDAVSIAIEIIDSRFENFKFSLEDVVADNCSSSGFIHGEWLPLETDFRAAEIQLSFDNTVMQKGSTTAILGDPVQSVFEASRIMLENGESIEEGNVILAGAATAAEYIKAGIVVSAASPGLGQISLKIS